MFILSLVLPPLTNEYIKLGQSKHRMDISVLPTDFIIPGQPTEWLAQNIGHTNKKLAYPGFIFYPCLSKVLANERRRYICNVFSHWLRPCWAENTERKWPWIKETLVLICLSRHFLAELPHKTMAAHNCNMDTLFCSDNGLNRFLSTHWGLNYMVAVLHTFSNIFFKENYKFSFWFHWNLFLRVQLMISQHWLSYRLVHWRC